MIRGEYWIEPGGDIRFADGDVGDTNHEGFAIANAQSIILDALDLENDCDGDVASFKHILEKSEENGASEVLAVAEKAGSIPKGISEIALGNGDPRAYAMENWAWKWVKGNHVASELFDAEDRASIANGIASILEEEGIDLADFDIEIAIASTGKRYSVNAEDAAAGNFGDIASGPVPTMPSAQVIQMDRDLQSQTYRNRPFGD